MRWTISILWQVSTLNFQPNTLASRAWLHSKQNKLRCRAALNLLIMSLRILFKAWPRTTRRKSLRRRKSRCDLTIVESDPHRHQRLACYGRPGNPGALTLGELQNMSTHCSNTCSVWGSHPCAKNHWHMVAHHAAWICHLDDPSPGPRETKSVVIWRKKKTF